MKRLRIIEMALVAIVLSAGLCACSDDDDSSDNNDGGLASQLRGTTWKVTSDTSREDYTGSNFTFNSDKSVIVTPSDNWWTSDDYESGFEWDVWENGLWWSVDGDVLTIDWNHDDCTEGTFIINGNTATYTYYWYDYNGEWSDKDKDCYIMVLQKQ